MGAVWRARDPATGREVALKLLATSGGAERLRREGMISASLSHPGIVRVFSAGEEGGRPFLVSELVEGARSLDQAWAGRPLRERAQLLAEVARAIGHAHTRGVVHRDLKPENVLVGDDGRARVTDFGLAAALNLERLTQTGAAVGTPTHMAPEQLSTRRASRPQPTLDVWALGVLLYQALTDQLPFRGESFIELAAAICAANPARPRDIAPSVPSDLEELCLACLAVDPSARPRDATAVAARLEAWLRGEPARSLRRHRRAAPGAIAVGLSLLILSAAGGLVAWRLAGRVRAVDDTGPARLELLEPAGDQETVELSVTFAGRVSPPRAGWVVKVGDRPAVRLDPDGRFTVRVDLNEGQNGVPVVLMDPQGEVTDRTARAIVRHAAPPWVRELSPERRPSLPLPEGVEFHGVGEFRNEKDGSILVWVPPGTFTMGSDEAPPMASALSEGPPHQVTLTRGFFIGKSELTWDKYKRFTQKTGRPAPRNPSQGWTGEHPVGGITGQDAFEYCRWAGLRLPSEVEWELAARGPDGRRYPWGDEDAPGRAVVGAETTRPVGSCPGGTSPFGCVDMLGNVAEYAHKRDGPYAAATDPPIDPRALLIRSCGFSAPSTSWGRTSVRWGVDATARVDNGFRVARSAD